MFEIIDTPAEADDAPDAAPLGAIRGEVRFEQVQLRLPARDARHQGDDPRGQGRGDAGAGGADRCGEDHHHQPADPLLRDRRREHHDRRHGHPRHPEGRPAPQAGDRSAGHLPLLGHGAGEHPLRTAGRPPTRSASRRPGWPDADPFIRQLPQGYQTALSERAGNLSQGQRQLLSIARAILADPAILILDEATSSVDTRTEARIQKALLQLMAGRTSFVIAHRLSTIRDADQVLVIDQGRDRRAGHPPGAARPPRLLPPSLREPVQGQAI
ncbi:MAG: ATP-binding cassette domain-containing protein [Candidatus Moduliflexus flocculans]|nr:ATP-binding cassette domain-containing protein [Candidatus Moduliflexus flocculans]